MSGWLQDFRYSLRSFQRRPLLIFSIVLTLAIGIGCNAAIFAFVDRLLLKPLPYPQPEQLLVLWELDRKNPEEPSPTSMSNAVDWMERQSSFDSVGVFTPWMPSLIGEGEPERLVGVSASSGYFAALKARPLLGRTIGAEEDRPGGDNVVVLSHGLWRRRFGGDPGIVGRSIRLGSQTYTVAGVLPASFRHPGPEYYDKVDVWSPLDLDPQPDDRGSRYLYTIARLKPTVGLEAARTDMKRLGAELEREHPDSNAGWEIAMEPLRDTFLGDLKGGLLLLALAAALLLLVACVNVTNLLLARTLERGQDLQIRAALGADRTRLARQPLAESLLLTLLAGGLALLLASWGIDLFRLLIPDPLPTGQPVDLSLRSLGFTLGIALIATLICGALPALRAASYKKAVRMGGNVLPEGRRGAFLNASMGVAEIALTLPLLIGGALLFKSFHNMTGVDLGFRPENLSMFEVSPGRTRYETNESYVNFFHRMTARVASVPGVESVALVNNAPFTIWNTSNYFTPEGWVPAGTEKPDAEYRTVSRSYFETMGIRLREGRLFDRTDRADSPGVVIVNRALAEHYWPGGSPVGRRLTLEDPASGKWLTVIGVVDDVRGSGVRTDPKPMIYRLFEQAPQRFMTVVLRTRGEIDGLPGTVRQAVWEIDKDLPVASFQSMEKNLSEALAGERSRTSLLGLFALTAMALTGFGVYTLLTHAVNKRLREFGVRLAVGASRRDILAVAMSRGLKVTLAGIVLGLFLAVSLAVGLRATLFEVRPFDPGVFLTGILLQTVVALLAIYLPSRRAAQVDPASVLRTL